MITSILLVDIEYCLSCQGVDSPGGDYMVVGGADGGDWGIESLEKACRHTYRCIGQCGKLSCQQVSHLSLPPSLTSIQHQWYFEAVPAASLRLGPVDLTCRARSLCAR